MNELDRLAEDNRELKASLRSLAIGSASLAQRLEHSIALQSSLEQRLQRVESSVVFRFLRWLGGVLAAAGLPVDRSGIPKLRTTDAAGPGSLPDRNYTTWVEEVSLRQRIWDSPGALAADTLAPAGALISVLLDAWGSDGAPPDRTRMERALGSLDAQRYTGWELLICIDAEPPEWLESRVANHRLQHPVEHRIEIVSGESQRSAVESALQKARGEFTALLPSDALLEPDAFERWLAAASSEKAAGPDTVAVYSDWDYIEPGGRRHTPRFTPEVSPELLEQTLYWGRCFLARTASIRMLNWPGGTPLFPVAEHDLAARLARHSGRISRVARMLWHMQVMTEDTPPARSGLARSPRATKSGDRVSVVICSRNAAQLRKCLKALLPTLDARHEVIVVAHHLRDQPALEQAAASYPVRTIPYDGPFHFGVMNGLGVAASSGQALCFLNDDVYPITSDWLELLLAQATRPEVGIVGALLLYPDGTIQHAGVAVGGWFLPAHIGRFRVESAYWPWLRMTREVTAVTGACMLLRRAVWEELGGFEPRFPVNYNDVDLCLRAAERGYKILIEAQAVLTHEESMTRVPHVRREESELFYERWSSQMSAPDKFFNPQLGHEVDSIELPSPWTSVR